MRLKALGAALCALLISTPAFAADPLYVKGPLLLPNGVTTQGSVPVVQTAASVALSMSTATTTQLVAATGTQTIYVTAFNVIAGGAGNFTLVAGTGSNCATGQTALTGAYPLTAQAGIAAGTGLGPLLVLPAGAALCATNSAAVQMSGSVGYAQF